jgi:hypothetical protein
MPFAKKPTPAATTTTTTPKAPTPNKPVAKSGGKKSVAINLPPALGCYVQVFEPREFQNDGKPKYSLNLLWAKDRKPELAPFKQAIVDCATSLFGAKAVEDLKAGRLKNPLRDGDVEKPGDPVYAGMYFINAKSDRRPGVVDRKLQPVLSTDDCYSGCIFRANIQVYAYDNKSKGVAVGLNALQVVEKGERLAGTGANAEEVFKEFSEADAEPKATPEADDLEPAAKAGNDLFD